MEQQLTGSCKWYDPIKGYGFITQDNGAEDVFLHHSDLATVDKTTLTAGDRVLFEIGTTDRGPKAINVKRDIAA